MTKKEKIAQVLGRLDGKDYCKNCSKEIRPATRIEYGLVHDDWIHTTGFFYCRGFVNTDLVYEYVARKQ